VLEVAWADLGGERHLVADREFGERVRADCVQELEACVDGVGDPDELVVDFAGCDLLEQLPFRRHQLPVFGRRPQQWLIMRQSADVGMIPAGADGRPAAHA
jgi:hypothetical protein